MAGHSKWKNIKHKKAASDAVKGKVFSRIAKEIMVAVRSGGADVSANITLRAMVQKARAANMPNDNIDRAIKRGSGEGGGVVPEEVVYEGFAPGGVAVVIQSLTDNRNRTAPEVRHVFTKFGANMATQGSVTRNFKRRGVINIPANGVDEDKLIEAALDAGADDVAREGDVFVVTTDAGHYAVIAEKLAAAGFKNDSAEATLIPELYVPVTNKEQAAQIMKFIEALEELDDVQNVYANCDIDDSLVEA